VKLRHFLNILSEQRHAAFIEKGSGDNVACQNAIEGELDGPDRRTWIRLDG
jgi:hypothetical protein